MCERNVDIQDIESGILSSVLEWGRTPGFPNWQGCYRSTILLTLLQEVGIDIEVKPFLVGPVPRSCVLKCTSMSVNSL